jgi:hypothetical protein
MGNIVGGKSRDITNMAIIINPCNNADFLAIGAQFNDRETIYDGVQDRNEYDPGISFEGCPNLTSRHSLGELGKPLVHNRMLPGGQEKKHNKSLKGDVNEEYNALKRWVEEEFHEQSWNAVAAWEAFKEAERE